MSQDLENKTKAIEAKKVSIKLPLLKSVELVKKKLNDLNKIQKQKDLSLKRLSIRKLLQSLQIPLCITSPSSTQKVIANEALLTSMKAQNLIPDKVKVVVRNSKACIHEQAAVFQKAKEIPVKGVNDRVEGLKCHTNTISE